MGILDAPALTRMAADSRYPLRASLNTAVFPLTGPNSSTTLGSNVDLTLRTIAKLNVTSKRWRLKFRNRDLLTNTVPNGSFVINNIAAGVPARPTTSTSGNRWVGNCTAALTQLSGASLTVPSDGAWAYSPWFTSSGDQFVAGVEKVLSVGLTASSGAVLAKGNAYQWAQATGSSNALNATLTSPTVGVNQPYGDICIEYETTESVRCVVFPGDSNTLGYSPGSPPLLPSTSPGVLPCESWPVLAGAMGGFIAINLGVGSAQTGNFDPNSSGTYVAALWDRIPAGCRIDAAINSLGTNDLASSLNSWIVQLQGINAYERTTLGVKSAWWSTITQRCYPDGSYGSTVDSGAIKAGYLKADIAAAATTFSSTTQPPTGTLLLGFGANAEDVTVSSVSGSAGDYTVTLSAGTVNAHYAGERWGVSQERLRTYKNNFLRQIPDGITGVFDFERAAEATPGSVQMDARYASGDWLHGQRGLSSIKAQMVVGAGVQPLFS